jgi:hypothetical protein
MRAKSRIIELMWAPGTQAGVQLAAVKFLQRVILVQSRGIADPRVSRSSFRLYVLVLTKGISLFPQSYKTKTIQASRSFQQTTHSSMLRLSKQKALLSWSV